MNFLYEPHLHLNDEEKATIKLLIECQVPPTPAVVHYVESLLTQAFKLGQSAKLDDTFRFWGLEECRCTCSPCKKGMHVLCNFRCDDANWRKHDRKTS